MHGSSPKLTIVLAVVLGAASLVAQQALKPQVTHTPGPTQSRAQDVHVRVSPDVKTGIEATTEFPTIQMAMDHHPFAGIGKDGRPGRVYCPGGDHCPHPPDAVHLSTAGGCDDPIPPNTLP